MVQQSFQHSAEAYDKHLLSKIGKSNSPPRHPSLISRAGSALAYSGADQTKDGGHLQRAGVTDSSAGSYYDPVSRWVTSPASAGSALSNKPGWRDQIEYRSSSVDSSAPSSAVDSDQHARMRDPGRRSLGGVRSSNDDATSLPAALIKNASDQQTLPTDSEPCFPMEETGGLRQLDLVDRTPPPNTSHGQPVPQQQGNKRRALSSALGTTRADKATSNGANEVSDMHSRAVIGHAYASASSTRLHPNHGSVSSNSSASLRNGSYTSSVGLSIGGSSMTSMSSIDKSSPKTTSASYERDAPPDGSLVASASLNPASLNTHSIMPPRSSLSQNPPESRSAGLAREISAQAGSQDSRSGIGPRIGGAFMCECCPKKPKKFENEEELRYVGYSIGYAF